MDLVICGSHRLFLDGLADALRSAGHTVSGTCYRLDWLPTVLSTMDPDACLLAVGRADGFGLRAATASRRSTSGTPLVLLLTEAADAEVWNAFDSGLIDGIADTTTCLSELDAALRRTVAGLDVAARPEPTPSRPQPVEQTLTRRKMEVLQLSLVIRDLGRDDVAGAG
jgi:DNA-binding NarL/FixJ family response regulator